jgi:flagellar biosynthesis/type III secretory pathway M-ring protein FliF/YscJ
MMEALAWIVVLLVIGLVFWSIARESEKKRRRTSSEYERDVADARSSLMRAGMLELDKFVGDVSGKRAAVEFLKDEEQGQTKTGGKDDDADRTEAEKPL